PFHVVIDMGGVNDIDTMGIATLERLVSKYDNDSGITLRFVNVKGTVADLVERAGWNRRTAQAVTTDSLVHYVKLHQSEHDYMI
ncbi:MAG: sodium-independent anion transporter, partial [Alkalicoccus sp.]